MKNTINWFSIPATDLGRAVKFYNSILEIEMKTEKMGDAEIAFFPIEDKEAVGGHIFATKEKRSTTDGPNLYLNGGDDLQTILSRVETAGGKVIQEKTQISPEIGYMALFIDTEGNKLALHSPN
jgi:predicted enzyme related to lactoylglutathione lyase